MFLFFTLLSEETIPKSLGNLVYGVVAKSQN